MADLEALVVAAYVFADEYPVPPRGGRKPVISDGASSPALPAAPLQPARWIVPRPTLSTRRAAASLAMPRRGGAGFARGSASTRALDRPASDAQYAPRRATTAGRVFARMVMSIQIDQFSR
jgi:hypothetical protein